MMAKHNTKFSKKKRQMVFEKSNGECQICGKPLHNDAERCYEQDYMQIDHIRPRSSGGDNQLSNLRALCRKCNCSRGKYVGGVFVNSVLRSLYNLPLYRDITRNLMADDIKNKLIKESDLDSIEQRLNYVHFKCLAHLKKLREDMDNGNL